MARRKDKRRRARPAPVAEAATVRAPQEPVIPDSAAEPAPERLSAPGGAGPTVAVIVISAVIAAVLLSGWTPGSVEVKGGGGSASPAPLTAPQPPAPVSGLGEIPAKNVFGAYCGICHTLAAVGAIGTVGPNLDELRPTRAEVLKAIRLGGRGTGQMPPRILHGKAAERVAAYVASVAGK